MSISGLNGTARSLAVYASQPGSPRHHARLAPGCWPALPDGAGYPQGPNERFPLSLPPFPGFSWRTKASLLIQACRRSLDVSRDAMDPNPPIRPGGSPLALFALLFGPTGV